jgi:hypothetical protein
METEKLLPCADKLAFDTKKQAEGSAAAIKFQRGTKLRAYNCKFCDLWHLASDFD